ncbi:hypothetical protein FA15DRAFT_660752 [Coprinopsis marcescibilis]|uniref:JmjC domain-containing protein n=1 Tax=Coprinopsis marcescibilis TaxID=230819 RepID=A0A5C3KEB5_COPMA|nr:hypothetical protein FA15DRAFT_660752 [Coprinopsis marcescibilis]
MASYYPEGAITASQQAIGSVLYLTSQLEKTKPTTAQYRTNFLRTMADEDRYSFVLVSEPLAPTATQTSIAEVSIDDLEHTAVTFSPSKMNKAREQRSSKSPAKANKAKQKTNVVTLADMPDPKGNFLTIDGAQSIAVEAPKVIDKNGAIVHPKGYMHTLDDGRLSWRRHDSICSPGKRRDIPKSSRRTCHMRLESITILPPDATTTAAAATNYIEVPVEAKGKGVKREREANAVVSGSGLPTDKRQKRSARSAANKDEGEMEVDNKTQTMTMSSETLGGVVVGTWHCGKRANEKKALDSVVPGMVNPWILPVVDHWHSGKASFIPSQLLAGLSILNAVSKKSGAIFIGPDQPIRGQCVTFHTIERGGRKPGVEELTRDVLASLKTSFFDSLANMKTDAGDFPIFCGQRDFFTREEPFPDLSYPISILDVLATDEGVMRADYQFPYKDDGNTELTPVGSSWTLPGSITHPHMDGYGERAFIIHFSVIKIWLVWPATTANLSTMEAVQCASPQTELTVNLIDRLEGLEVMVLGKGEVAFTHKANMIHACLSLTESAHLGFYIRRIPFFAEASKVLAWVVQWVRMSSPGTAPRDEIRREAIRIQEAVQSWEALVRKKGGNRVAKSEVLRRSKVWREQLKTFLVEK